MEWSAGIIFPAPKGVYQVVIIHNEPLVAVKTFQYGSQTEPIGSNMTREQREHNFWCESVSVDFY